MATMKEKALRLASRGFAVFPLQPNSKKPLPGSAGFKDATTNYFEIEAWWTEHPDANIGLYPDACRPRLLVVDVDVHKGGDETLAALEKQGLMPSVPMVSTPSGGHHRYYALGEDAPRVASSVEKLGKGVDVRAHGGYVVAPGSVIDGKEYRWIGTFDRVWAPLPLIHACGRAEQRHPDADKWLVEPDLEINAKHARDWLSTTEAATAGNRNIRAYQTAAMLRDRGISEETALAMMGELFNPRNSPPLDQGELELVVRSAYKTAQRPAGSEAKSRKAKALQATASEPEPEKQAPAPEWRSGEGHLPFPSLTRSQLKARPKLRWLIKKVLRERGVQIIRGAYGHYKTSLAMDQACHLMLGLDWAGFKVRQDYSVAFVAAEGDDYMNAGVDAWEKHHDRVIPDDRLRIIAHCPMFGEDGEGRLRASLDYWRIFENFRPEIIYIDTLARITAGLDENSGKDMSPVLAALTRIGQEYGCLVCIIHHYGKDAKRGSRGWSGMDAGADAIIDIEADTSAHTATYKVHKQKGARALEDPLCFQGRFVETERDEDGEAEGALVFEPVAYTSSKAEKDDKIKGHVHLNALVKSLTIARASEEHPVITVELAKAMVWEMLGSACPPEQSVVFERHVAAVKKWLNRNAVSNKKVQRYLSPAGEISGARSWYNPDLEETEDEDKADTD